MGGRGNGRGGSSRGRQNGNVGRNGGGGGRLDVEVAVGNLQIGGDAASAARGGRGGARGGARSRLREVNLDDVIKTKPDGCTTKQGKFNSGTEKQVGLVANFYNLKVNAFSVMQYSVHFRSEVDIYNQTGRKRYLLAQLKDDLPRMRLFTGDSIFTAERLRSDEIVRTAFCDSGDEKIPVEITIKLVKMVQKTDPGYIQVLNHVNDQQLRTMGLSNVGRSHFDIAEKRVFAQHRLEIWPGISSTIRWQEKELMLKVELTNKVVRQDTAYDTLNMLRGDPIRCKQALLGATVVTSYNNDKTYRIDDIDFSKNPENARFEHAKMGTVSIKDYFKRQYRCDIRDPRQPLLVSMPKKKDVRRSGQIEPILLVPELCRMTGLTDNLRSNYNAMRDMAVCLKMDPSTKLNTIKRYGRKFATANREHGVLRDWGLEVGSDPVRLQGRVLANQAIYLGGRGGQERTVGYDNPFKSEWTNAVKDGMLTATDLKRWCVVFPQRMRQEVEEFFAAMKKISPNLRFNIAEPPTLYPLRDDRGASYVQQIRELVKSKPCFVVTVFPRQLPEVYKAVKAELLGRYGIPNQVLTGQKCMARDRRTGGIKLAIATKVAVQMACKLGAVPWKVGVPLKDCMIVGFDTFHNKKSGRKSVGALTASYDANWCRYYSVTSQHEEQNEISDSMSQMFLEGLRYYCNENGGKMPTRIFFYRDGVGEGQLQHIVETEVANMQKAIDSIPNEVKPKLTVTIVSKRIAPRFFKEEGRDKIANPAPGTVVDDVVTLPERFDFFLVSQSVTEGTVNPTSYNIILDQNNFPAERHQLLAYKLCHVYPNWPGTIRVPAPCQLAHKLAYLLGENDLENAHRDLRPTLFCL